MSWGNKFFEFDEPVRWFKAVGQSPSNTYVGSSRAIDTVYEQTLANPGDALHALTGGTFLVRKDGTVESGRFKLPKHIFEKTYGLPETDADILGRMAARGICHEVPAPAGRFEYHAARKAADANRFPDCTGSVTNVGYVESPLLRTLSEAAASSGLEDAVREAGWKLHKVDVGRGGDANSLDACIQVQMAQYVSLDMRISPVHDKLIVSESEKIGFAAALKAFGGENLGMTPEHRSETTTFFPAGDAEAMMRALGRYVAEGHVAEPTSPTP